MVYSVLIVFNDSVLSLPSTIYAPLSMILYTGMEGYGYYSKHLKKHTGIVEFCYGLQYFNNLFDLQF